MCVCVCICITSIRFALKCIIYSIYTQNIAKINALIAEVIALKQPA